MLSTSDNPFNPFTDFDSWFTWDTSNGYNSSGLLARLVVSSDQLSEADQEADREEAIDRIVELNPNGMFIKVTDNATSA